MKKTFIALSLIIGLVGAVFVYQTIDSKVVIDIYKNAPLFLLILYPLIFVLIQIFQTLRWYLVLRSEKQKVPFHRLFSYRLAGYSVSYLTPGAQVGGEPVRAAILKKREGIRFSKAFSSVIIDKSLEMTFSFFLLVIGAILLLFSISTTKPVFIIMSLLFILFLLGGVVFFYKSMNGESMFSYLFKKLKISRIKGFKKYEKELEKTEQYVSEFFKKNKIHFFYALLINIILWALMFLEYYLALKILGITSTSFTDLFLIITLVGLAFTVPIPAAIGVLELGQVIIFSALKNPVAIGLALTILIRVRDVIFILIGLAMVIAYGVTGSAKKVVVEGKEE